VFLNLPTEARVRVAYRKDEEAVVELFRHMNEMIIQFIGRIQTLENQIAKNSSNSNSKPLSSDGHNKPSPKSLRQRHKKNGGQPGHTRKTRQMVLGPDRV